MSLSTEKESISSFTTKKINSTTFVIREDDAYGEHPFIYVKLHPLAPVIIISDTGCDEPSEKYKHARYTHLRPYLETHPVKSNNNQPLNPSGKLQYLILLTHCHYDHLGGIAQFLESGSTTEIIASAAGRDFLQTDLGTHGLFDAIGKPIPFFQITHWAQAFERLHWPLMTSQAHLTHTAGGHHDPVDLGITIIPTPGHTPDEMAWYDHDEMHLYVGDSMYPEGPEDGMPILFPSEGGNLIEYGFSMQKLQFLVRGENGRAVITSTTINNNNNNNNNNVNDDDDDEDFVQIPRRVKLAAGHQTHSEDAEEFFERVGTLWRGILQGEIPVVKKKFPDAGEEGEEVWRWRGNDDAISLEAPKRMMEDARRFFLYRGSDVLGDKGGSWL
ncbi:Hypothetical predicted protein [Lecanosticta acicola]|uniref:Metallo-beta-lactamase domain-containing protein n=1 Tax=Lecanosticta acicola TaxID=111012 RepID=A0AAI8Z750_9PEZI|nr:Hypothetical predicted protein [Lecanosticta acicola]